MKRQTPRGRRRLLRWGAGIAMAAAACLAIVVTNQTPIAPVTNEFTRLDAFEAFASDSLEETIAILGDDISELELAFFDEAADDLEDSRVDQLLDDIQTFELNDNVDDWS